MLLVQAIDTKKGPSIEGPFFIAGVSEENYFPTILYSVPLGIWVLVCMPLRMAISS